MFVDDSLANYHNDYFIQTIVMCLIIFGAIGFPAILELKHFIFKRKKSKLMFRFSLFTKVTTITFGILISLGTIFIYFFDINGFFNDKVCHEGLFYALFHSVAPRSAGLSTVH